MEQVLGDGGPERKCHPQKEVEVPPLAQGRRMMEGAGMRGMSRTGLAGERMKQQLGHPVLLHEPASHPPTHSPGPRAGLRSSWSHRREGGGHRDAQLAQLVWLVLASWQWRALGTGEDVAGST